jgi:metal-sulfur cluster biosynthetic enzyme
MSDVAVLDEAAIMAVLDKVMDPEIPAVSITDLGIIRGLADGPPRVRVTPTYTGCPATIAIERLVRDALDEAGYNHVGIERVLFPPWTTAWITHRGRQVSRRCFVATERKLILPAFGALTGGLDATHPEIVRAVGAPAEALVPVADRLLRFPLAA